MTMGFSFNAGQVEGIPSTVEKGTPREGKGLDREDFRLKK